MLGYLVLILFVSTIVLSYVLYYTSYQLDIYKRKAVPFAYRKIVLDDLLKDIYSYTSGVSKPWLYYGTLLGSVRSNAMIEWDYDLDLGVNREDYDITLKAIKGMVASLSKYRLEVSILPFVSRSFKVVHVETGLSADVSSFTTSGGRISRDVWGLYSRYICHESSSSMPVDYINPVVPVKYEGVDVFIPAKSGDVLPILYGKDYGTPDHVCNEYGYCKKR
uniref:LicD/FKTN/FKRP nucleotidyltransferase domain-containing protein n=1 Tax=viral metagenome TaxID=1070528 RepID=A0A6C0LXQ1_9ZZZZ